MSFFFKSHWFVSFIRQVKGNTRETHKTLADHRTILYIIYFYGSQVQSGCCCHFLLTCFFFFLYIYAGGPGVHDPCERDPTDVLSDLSPQQADIVTESAQVSHTSCRHPPLPLLPSQPFPAASEVFLTRFSRVSVRRRENLLSLFVHIYCTRKTVEDVFLFVISGCLSGRQWAVVFMSGWSSTGVKALLQGIS